MIYPCPICNQEMKHEVDTINGWCVCEEYFTCPKGHYSEEYTYGFWREFVGKREYFTGSYMEDKYTLRQKIDLKITQILCKLHILFLRFQERTK